MSNHVAVNQTTALSGTEPQAWAIDPWVAMVERAARDPSIDADKMIKLFDLSERAQASRARAAFAADFALMQARLPRIDRRGRIVIYSETDRKKTGGPTASDRPQQDTPYARLEDIVDAIAGPLSEYGFSVSHRIERTPEGLINVTGILTHRDGHSERTSFPLPHDSSGSKNSVQAIGSSITYGRRYTILSLLNIVSHAPMDADDDAQRAVEKDLPVIDVGDVTYIETLLRDTDSDKPRFLKWVGAESIESMNVEQFKRAAAFLEAKKRKQSNA